MNAHDHRPRTPQTIHGTLTEPARIQHLAAADEIANTPKRRLQGIQKVRVAISSLGRSSTTGLELVHALIKRRAVTISRSVRDTRSEIDGMSTSSPIEIKVPTDRSQRQRCKEPGIKHISRAMPARSAAMELAAHISRLELQRRHANHVVPNQERPLGRIGKLPSPRNAIQWELSDRNMVLVMAMGMAAD